MRDQEVKGSAHLHEPTDEQGSSKVGCCIHTHHDKATHQSRSGNISCGYTWLRSVFNLAKGLYKKLTFLRHYGQKLVNGEIGPLLNRSKLISPQNKSVLLLEK